MPYIVTSPCIGSKDQSCVEVCPVDCIHEVAQMVVIDPEACIDCNACVQACPVDAIYADDEVPVDQRPFIAINHAFADGLDAVERALRRWTLSGNTTER